MLLQYVLRVELTLGTQHEFRREAAKSVAAKQKTGESGEQERVRRREGEMRGENSKEPDSEFCLVFPLRSWYNMYVD